MAVEHFLPFRKSSVISLCAGELPAAERAGFAAFAGLLGAVAHYRFHRRGDAVLDAYQVVDPAQDVRSVGVVSAGDKAAARRVVEDELVALAEEADFVRIDAAEIASAFAEDALVKVRLEVEDDEIDTVMFFRRGVSQRSEQVKWLYGLRRRSIEFTSYSKVLVYVAFKDRVLLKLFQNVPKNDLEMLYPSVRVHMRPIDKLLIGVPAVVSGIIVLVTKLVGSLGLLILLLAFYLGLRDESVRLDQAALVTLGAGIAAFTGYLIRQFSKFKNRKIKLLKTLSEHLYFRNLDNGPGVFHHLLDAAEESEFKEALLAYHFLRTTPHPLTAADLDGLIESWFRRHWNTTFDFEVRAGLRTLTELGLLTENADGTLAAPPIAEARHRLDRYWDNAFRT
ncbi:TMEM143 family protein [Nocardia inohanensis]|uniref:TMEM143 family protein n=1 Tax=Nocardia inohanensis TaxID=209246 RepID=UPI0008297201|nr:TMEM143 family protein [Nocardia inohanensis]